jgi:hypothetical protein
MHMSQADKEAQLEIIKQRLSQVINFKHFFLILQLKRTAMEVSSIIPTVESRKHKLNPNNSFTSERVTSQKISLDSTPRSVKNSEGNPLLSQSMRLGSSLRASHANQKENEGSSRLNRTINSRIPMSTTKPKVESTKPSRPHVEVTRSAVKAKSTYSVTNQPTVTPSVQKTKKVVSAIPKVVPKTVVNPTETSTKKVGIFNLW